MAHRLIGHVITPIRVNGRPSLPAPFPFVPFRASRGTFARGMRVIVAIYRPRYGLINNSRPRRETRTRRLDA